MPELPEVETIAVEMRSRILGAVVSEVRVRRADFIRTPTRGLARRLRGRRVEAVVREGKRITLRFDDGAVMCIHLGMSGRLTFVPTHTDLAPHTHLICRFCGIGDEMRLCDPRRFGGVWYSASGDVDSLRMGRLGPDALSISNEQFVAICRRRRRIKALLLDQQVISGMGNIYCDEALFGARVHPMAIASELAEADVRALGREMRRTLNRALRFGGSTLRDYVRADGRAGAFQRLHRVYGREGRPCPRCRRSIERMVVAGRSTHLCIGCQTLGIEEFTFAG